MADFNLQPNRTVSDEAHLQSHERSPLSIVYDLEILILHNAKFSTAYADPPWPYSNTAARSAAENHYRTMSLEAIRNEPVSRLVADQAHLHLWTTKAFLREAFDVIRCVGLQLQVVLDLGQAAAWHGKLLASLARASVARRSRESTFPRPHLSKLAIRAPHSSQPQAVPFSRTHRTSQPRFVPKNSTAARNNRVRSGRSTGTKWKGDLFSRCWQSATAAKNHAPRKPPLEPAVQKPKDCQQMEIKHATPPWTDSSEPDPAVLINAEQFARMLGISPRTLWRLLSAQRLIQPIRLGGSTRWRLEEVRNWIEQGCPSPESR